MPEWFCTRLSEGSATVLVARVQEEMMDLPALIKQMDELEAQYQTWVEPINQVIRESSYKVNRGGYTSSDFDHDVAEVWKEQRSKFDPYPPIYSLLDSLCPAYLEAPAEDRTAIRAAVRGKVGIQHALLGYVLRVARRIHTPADRGWLLNGLAAVSIENCSKDYRDVVKGLAELYVAAEKAGLSPMTDFNAVSRLSSTKKPTGGEASVAALLANFQKFGPLRERKKR